MCKEIFLNDSRDDMKNSSNMSGVEELNNIFLIEYWTPDLCRSIQIK